jgi:ATP synthase protein I
MPESENEAKTWARYSGLAFQMLGSIGLLTWLGTWLDAYSAMAFPLWTVLLSVLGVIGSIMLVYRGVMSNQK